MHTFHERKAERAKKVRSLQTGYAKRKCVACSGSGRYDHKGSPKCQSCGGSGMEWYKPVA